MTYPKCDRCAHQWHGLPCPTLTHPRIETGRTPGPCMCPSPYDDTYWTQEPA